MNQKDDKLTQNHAVRCLWCPWLDKCSLSAPVSPAFAKGQWLQNLFSEFLSTLQKEATQRGSARCEERLLLLHMPSLAPALSR